MMVHFSPALVFCISYCCISSLPPGAELFLPAKINAPMSVQSGEYKFSITNADSKQVIAGTSNNGGKIEHYVSEAGFENSERLYVVESHGCGGESIDLVMQIAPGNNSDINKRNYYRIVFSKDLRNAISEFYDPSISAANAILPIQSVEGMVDSDTGLKIVCDSKKPALSE